MKSDKKEMNSGMGVGLGFILAGIFTFNLHLFLGINPILIQKIFGVVFSLIGVAGMLLELGKEEDKDYLKDISAAIILFVPIFSIFLALEILWLKIVFAVLVNICLIFVGMAFGRTFLSDDGSFRIDTKKLGKTIIALLATIGAVISAINAFVEKLPNFLDRLF